MEITIRKADAADLDAVVRVYEHVHDAEEAGPAQVGWVRGVYPVRSTAEAALERGDLFVEEAVGAVSLICAQNVAAMAKGEPLKFQVV